MTGIVKYVFRCTYAIHMFTRHYSNCVTEKIALQNQPHDTITQWRRVYIQ